MIIILTVFINSKMVHKSMIGLSFSRPKKRLYHITIYVHGTKPQEIIPTKLQYFSQSIEAAFFYDQGFYHIAEISPSVHIGTMLSYLARVGYRNFSADHMYCFGWSGKLNHEERSSASTELYRSTKKNTSERLS
jgi:hypothetical protein